jgi:hypothetical protein
MRKFINGLGLVAVGYLIGIGNWPALIGAALAGILFTVLNVLEARKARRAARVVRPFARPRGRQVVDGSFVGGSVTQTMGTTRRRPSEGGVW